MKKDTVSFDTFAALDIRVGTVMEAEDLEKSEKLLVLTVDLGEDYGTAEIMAGIKQWYTPEELKGKKMLFLANLEHRKMMGRESQGMMLAVDGEDKPILLEVNGELANGTYVR